MTKTKDAVAALRAVKAYDDVAAAKNSRRVRSGKGKLRNRRYVARKGPLVVYSKDDGITKAFRNLPGVQLCNVERLNLLTLAPGGHVGRFIVWTESAFRRLDAIYGTETEFSKAKSSYRLPRQKMINADVAPIIHSDTVQTAVRPAKENGSRRSQLKKNPLKNLGVMLRLNPYQAVLRKAEQERQSKAAAKKKLPGSSKGYTQFVRSLE